MTGRGPAREFSRFFPGGRTRLPQPVDGSLVTGPEKAFPFPLNRRKGGSDG
jgi:hypothetical protein